VSSGSTRSLFWSLWAQGEVVYALVLRETRTRFGDHQMGYLWALLEPIIMILTFYILFEFADRDAPPGMDLFTFVSTGILPYLLFSSSVSRVADSISGNRALLFYPQVRPLDLVFARMSLEFLTYGIIFLILMFSHAVWMEQFSIDSALMVLFGLILASLLGSTVGLIFCAMAQFSKVADRARGPLMRPLFWISGLFFTAHELPSGIRELALYNPVLHVVEVVRSGWFPSYKDTYVDSFYVLSWILVFTLLGLTLERVVRRRIEVT